MWKLIEQRFKQQTKFWLSKAGNFDKHVDFLKKRILGRFSDSYDAAELAEALDTFKSDPDTGVDRIFDALKVALERKFQFEMQKGGRILSVHNTGSAEMQDLGNGQIGVPSESNASKTYTVDLTKLECECQSAKTLSYAGLLCKHTTAAVEAFKHRYPVGLEAEEKPAEDFRMEKSEDVKADSDSDEYFVYGGQKLKKRQLTGNPLIPSGIFTFWKAESQKWLSTL